MDRLVAMQTFVRVVETGSFSAVARELRSTQSAVSKQVAALEKHLGAQLLTRTTRSLALTEDGRRYFEDARRLSAELLEAEAAVRHGEQQLSGWLRVAAPVGFGRLVLMPLVQSFLRLHAGVRIDLRLDDGFIDLVEQGVDVAVRLGELADSSLVARRIGWSHRQLIASRRYLDGVAATLGPPQTLDDLRAHNCIAYTPLLVRGGWPLGGDTPTFIEGNLQTNSSEAVRAAVLADMGISFSPTWLFAGELADGSVQALLPEHPVPPMPVHLISPPQRRHAAKVRAFADHVAEQMSETP